MGKQVETKAKIKAKGIKLRNKGVLKSKTDQT